MKKTTKTILTATVITAGAAAAASLSAYLTAEQFMKIALDRDAPKIMKKTGNRISGAVKDPLQESFREQLRSASEHLAQQENETVEITGYDGETLVGHFIPCENAKRIIIAMHGWRSSWHRDFGMISDFWHNSGCSVLYAEQRGQNNSGGDYMGFGLTERYDCLEWIRWVNERFGENLPIYLGGVSMGATTVLMAAGLNLPENVHGIVADCGFTSPDAICRHIANENLHMTYKLKSKFADRICRKKLLVGLSDYSAPEALKNTNIPVLFIHGETDHFVPVEMTYENYDACVSPKQILIVPGADHAMSYFIGKNQYEAAVKEFWREFD